MQLYQRRVHGELSNDIQARSSGNNFCVVPHHLHLLHHHHHPHLQRLQQPATNFQLYLLKPRASFDQKWTPSERKCSLLKVRPMVCMRPFNDLKTSRWKKIRKVHNMSVTFVTSARKSNNTKTVLTKPSKS